LKRNEKTIKLLSVGAQLPLVRDLPFDLSDPESTKLMTVKNIMMWVRFTMIIDRQPALDRDILRLDDSMKQDEKENDDLRKNKLR